MEVKFSVIKKNEKNGSKLPKWNSNIPKNNSIYLYSHNSKTIYFKGSKFIAPHTRNELMDFFESFDEKNKLSNLREKLTTEKHYNPLGLSPSIRIDFLYRNDFKVGNSNNKILDIFNICYEYEWQKDVDDFLDKLNGEYNNESH